MIESPISPEQLQVSLLREQVTDLLRQAIVTLRLRPGQRLLERELVRWTGVSRPTVREAIRQLAAEGLVKTVPQRGAVVASPTTQEAEELYDVRAMLEGRACRQFVERASDAQVRALRKAFERLARVATASAETSPLLQAKDGFYEVLLEGAANQTIRDILGSLQARISMLRATSMSSPDRRPAMVEEIRAIVEAIEARDGGGAERACVAHVRAAAGVALGVLGQAPEEEPQAR